MFLPCPKNALILSSSEYFDRNSNNRLREAVKVEKSVYYEFGPTPLKQRYACTYVFFYFEHGMPPLSFQSLAPSAC